MSKIVTLLAFSLAIGGGTGFAASPPTPGQRPMLSRPGPTALKALVTVAMPNGGGEPWKLGTTRNIVWTTSTPALGMVRLLLFKGNTKLGRIAELPGHQGTYAWQVGKFDNGMAGPGDDYRIKVKVVGKDVFDFSDGFFSIAEPPDLTIKNIQASCTQGGSGPVITAVVTIDNTTGAATSGPAKTTITVWVKKNKPGKIQQPPEILYVTLAPAHNPHISPAGLAGQEVFTLQGPVPYYGYSDYKLQGRIDLAELEKSKSNNGSIAFLNCASQ